MPVGAVTVSHSQHSRPIESSIFSILHRSWSRGVD